MRTAMTLAWTNIRFGKGEKETRYKRDNEQKNKGEGTTSS
jgi:hypothetical protein